nr:MAG TPA: hypothetical protein [Bacteriophage sp.]
MRCHSCKIHHQNIKSWLSSQAELSKQRLYVLFQITHKKYLPIAT